MIVTHNGVFHADDVLGYAILQMAGQDIGPFVRTRDPATIAQADIAFDVGEVCDPTWGRFDHHQRGGAGTRSNGVPYAAAGLLWAEFGAKACRDLAESHGLDPAALAARVDEALIQGVDALDNGVVDSRHTLRGGDVEVRIPSVSSALSGFNPVSGESGADPGAFDRWFRIAADIARPILARAIVNAAESMAAAAKVRAADSGGPILVLPGYVPWQEVVAREMPHVLIAVFPAANGQWNAQAAPVAAGTFDNRIDLPEAWRGQPREKLVEVTGVADAVFCHQKGFICGARSREGALRLAELALQLTQGYLCEGGVQCAHGSDSTHWAGPGS